MPSYLEALQLVWGVFVVSQAGVEDEQLSVTKPHLQLLDARLQLLQQ